MPRILPFRGVRYDPGRAPDLTRVTAPPYDMISPAEQEELYRRDPHNVVRLILGRTEEDGRPVDRYANTAAEITPIREVDRRAIGPGARGPVTKAVQEAFFSAVRGENPKYRSWLTPVR